MEKRKQTLSSVGSVLLLVLAAVSLFLAESSYWINHTIFNQATFSRTVTEQLLEANSRQAIATAIVDKTLEDRPLLKRAFGERATALVAGLLDTNASRQALNTVNTKAYAYITSPDREDITIDMTSVKTFTGGLLALAQSQGGGEKIEAIDNQIPEEIVLVTSDDAPDVSGLVQTMLWLGPLFWLASAASFAGYLYMHRKRYARATYVVLAVIAGVALIGLFVPPFVPAPIAAAAANITLRPVISGLVESFLAPFIAQMLVLLVISAVAAIIFSQRFAILRMVQSLSARMAGGSPAVGAKKPTRKSKKS